MLNVHSSLTSVISREILLIGAKGMMKNVVKQLSVQCVIIFGNIVSCSPFALGEMEHLKKLVCSIGINKSCKYSLNIHTEPKLPFIQSAVSDPMID